MADRIEKILLQLDIDTSQLVVNLQKANDKIDLLKKQIDRAKLDLKEMEKAGISSGASYDNLVRQINGFEVSLKVASDESRNYTKQLKLIEQGNASLEGSLNEQKALLSILTAQYNELSEEERLNTESGKKLGAEILKITDNLKSQEQAIGNARRNVGNYQAAITAAFDAFNKAKGGVNDVKLAIEQLNQKLKEGGISEKEYNTEIGQLNQQLQESQSETEILGQKLDDLKNIVTENGQGFKSLRQRLREARDEATLAQDKFSAGLISEDQLVSSQQKVADLSEEMGDFNKRVEALNPEAKFKAFTQVAQGAAGAIGVVTGGMGLLGSESDDAAQALLKVQQFMQFSQGLNQIAELGDSFKNLSIVLGFTTTAQKAQSVAQVQSATSATANAAATTTMAAAEQAAIIPTTGLAAAMNLLLGPVGLVLLGIAAVAAAFAFIGSDDVARIEDLTDAIDAENNAHKRTVDILKQRNSEATSTLQNELDAAKANGASETELSNIRESLRKQQEIGLVQERTANEQHLNELVEQKKRAEAIIRDKDQSEDDQKTAAESLKRIDADINQTKIENANITNIELKKLANERVTEEAEAGQRLKDSVNAASIIRISLIKDAKTRELAAERESNKQNIAKLLLDEKTNAELIIAEKQASNNRIKEINLKFALQEIQERNAIDIAGTVEGTEARIEAERLAAERIRDFQLANDTLTANAKLQIEKDTIKKIGDLKIGSLNIDREKGNREIEAAQDSANAIIAIKRAQADSPESVAGAEIEQIESDLAFELLLIENAADAKVAQLEIQKQTELNLLRSGNDDQAQATDEYKQRVLEINKRYNDAINVENASADAKATQQVIESGQNTVNAITEIGDKKIQALINLRQAEIDAADPENQIQAQLSLLDAQEQAELASFQRRLQAGEAFAAEETEIVTKYTNARIKIKQNELNVSLAATSNLLDATSSLMKKSTVAYKIFASASAVVSTYSAAAQALADTTVPNFYVRAANAAVAVLTGLSYIGQINGVQFYDGGYTGDGDPRSVSTAVGRKPYTYHKREYVIDHKTLSDPAVSSFVSGVIEPKRLNRLNISPMRVPVSSASHHSFETGGFAQVPLSSTMAINIQQVTAEEIRAIVGETVSQMKVSVAVQDISEQQGIVTKVEGRANH